MEKNKKNVVIYHWAGRYKPITCLTKNQKSPACIKWKRHYALYKTYIKQMDSKNNFNENIEIR